MYHVYVFTLPALLWLLVLWRAPSACNGSRPSRLLWGFLVSIAVALTTRPPAVEHLVRAATGSPDLSVLLKHLAGLASNYFILEYVITVHGRGPRRPWTARLRIAAAAAAALALTVVFVFFFQHDPDGPPSRVTDAHLGDWSVRLYEGIVYAYLGTSGALAARLFWSNRRSVPRGVLRSGVVCLAGGCALTVGYTAYRVFFLAEQHSRPGTPGPGTVDPVSETLPVVILLLLAVGLVLPPLRGLARYGRDQYALWRLHPLWADLLHAVPEVAFGPRVGRTRDLFILGDRTLDVAHRAFEIRDACLVLRERSAYGGPGGGTGVHGAGAGTVAAVARTVTADARTGLAEEPHARAEAAWLHAVLHGEGDGYREGGAAPLPWNARTPREEIGWLLKVAEAYGRVPRGA
ncbi:MAB_1171c family putative transporter [Streptomyces sp. NPDC093225]|uniref:MAB_1171c family putative transporter n=1 Tax=Streptomyces sp. NPDC093225 TaxID=3366034 RepID=UPI00382EB345